MEARQKAHDDWSQEVIQAVEKSMQAQLTITASAEQEAMQQRLLPSSEEVRRLKAREAERQAKIDRIRGRSPKTKVPLVEA